MQATESPETQRTGFSDLPVELVEDVIRRVGDLVSCVRLAKSGIMTQIEPADVLKLWGNWPCEYLLYH